MKEPLWLAPETVIDIHAELIAHFGGRAGLRDRGALEAALDRPRNKYAYGEARLARLAAAYAYGLTRGHAFVDGDKRIGFAAMLVFLGLNGLALRAPEPEATALMFAHAAGEVGEGQAAGWIDAYGDTALYYLCGRAAYRSDTIGTNKMHYYLNPTFARPLIKVRIFQRRNCLNKDRPTVSLLTDIANSNPPSRAMSINFETICTF